MPLYDRSSPQSRPVYALLIYQTMLVRYRPLDGALVNGAAAILTDLAATMFELAAILFGYGGHIVRYGGHIVWFGGHIV